MTATQTTHPKAHTGRRINFTYHHDLTNPRKRAYPGIITGTETPLGGTTLALIRLDGSRSNLHIPVDADGLTYLDQVTPVPALPMGRFQPTLDDLEGAWAGVPICSLSDDGQAIALTGDLAKAVEAINTYRRDISGCLYHPAFDTVTGDDLVFHWAYFEWQPADAECPWLVHWTREGDDQAIQLHHLPA